MAPSAGDIPGLYDVIINGKGYVFADAIQPSLPFRTQRARYTYSAPFIERTNVTGDYGDASTAFFLTFTQRDWSEGEGQRHYHGGDADSARQYWTGSKVDVSKPGQIMMARDTGTATAAAAIKAVVNSIDGLYYATSTNLYQVDSAGAISDKSAHGLGVTPKTFGMCRDWAANYLTSTAGGTVGVRKWSGGVYSTFSASSADTICYLNNTLFGFAGGILYRWDTAGTRSTVYTWKSSDGGTITAMDGRLAGFGGDLLILTIAVDPDMNGHELWLYDGNAPAKINDLPINFDPWAMEVAYGVVYISGRLLRGGSSINYKPCIYYYAQGTPGKLWEADTWTASDYKVALTQLGSSLVWNDDTQGKLLAYDLGEGGFSSVGAYTVAGDTPLLAASAYNLLHSRNQVTAYYFPGSAMPTSSTLTTSLYDGDSSLMKRFSDVTLDFDLATDGNGGTVDVAYRTGDVDGSYTTIGTGITAGTPVTIGAMGVAISFKITLNKGTSTLGPVIERIRCRAAPIMSTFRQCEYILDLTGRDDRNDSSLVKFRDQSLSGRDGMTMAAELNSAVGSVVTVIDRFGTFSGVIETDGFEILEIAPEEFYGRVAVRQV